jgi:hypothetical protein
MSVVQLALEQTQITDWQDVDRFLRDQGRPKRPVGTAVDFYRTELAVEFAGRPVSALLELLGIDFDAPVTREMLPRGDLATFVKASPALGIGRPNEGRVRTRAGTSLALQLGAFFTVVGTDPQSLGISIEGRQGVHVRVLRPIPALRSRASGLVDVWTERPAWRAFGTPRLVGGGGIQLRVPRRMASSDEYLAIL